MGNWEHRFKVVPAVYVIFRDGNKILLLKRTNTGFHDGDYSFPSGHLEGGESAKQAAKREAKEEVGVDIEPEDLRLVHVEHRIAEEGDHERIHMFFWADKWSGEPYNAEPHKATEILWADVDDLPDNLIREARNGLLLGAKGIPYSEYNFT